MAEVLRTPEERFIDLPDFPYTSIYIDDLKGFELKILKFAGVCFVLFLIFIGIGLILLTQTI